MNVAESVTELVGGTPLVRLNRVVGDCGATILGKLESFNPGNRRPRSGQVDDRRADEWQYGNRSLVYRGGQGLSLCHRHARYDESRTACDDAGLRREDRVDRRCKGNARRGRDRE